MPITESRCKKYSTRQPCARHARKPLIAIYIIFDNDIKKKNGSKECKNFRQPISMARREPGRVWSAVCGLRSVLGATQARSRTKHPDGDMQGHAAGVQVLRRLCPARRFEDRQRQIDHQGGTGIGAGAGNDGARKGLRIRCHSGSEAPTSNENTVPGLPWRRRDYVQRVT